ncbi:T9SS type A sorting domain-containing protein [Ichthyenterobacterium sp. W332]|uniref:T9SS type A sorting domain-containing protein n=1 Tax=Microcosmobacter mediterraneus TaxID=3075607 RepID=A0ABU2YKZ9_9FLAO|nr:T9SS type A sorting domain-containing protein [Ichthyenterobacterium sp. W332]MDT0558732.1 T9SS type A sorting domain-containing protein [Ichthyenterobacterium sp. W332]
MICPKSRYLLLVCMMLISTFCSTKILAQDYDLDTSTETYWPQPVLNKPDYLQSVIDPNFDTSITRITGDVNTPIPNSGGATWRNIARHGYSVRQPWNADESIIYLGMHKTYGGGWGSVYFLDGETYEVIKTANIPSSNDSRWHPTDPSIRLLVNNSGVRAWNYYTEQITTLISYSGYTNTSLGDYTGNFSQDGTKAAILATRSADGMRVAFAVDLENNIKYPDIELPGTIVDFITISPLGNYIIVNANFGTGYDRSRVFTIQGDQTGPFWSEYGRPSHFDVAIDENGDEVAVGVDKTVNDGRIIKRRLSDGQATVLTPGGYASHASARSLNRPGWVYTYMSSSTSWQPYLNELVAVKLDGSRVERICKSRNAMNLYENQAQPCPSPSGGRVMFASDWGNNNVPIQCYVVDFRDKIIEDGQFANAGEDQEICTGDSVTLTASGGVSYEWSTGETTQSITVSPTTTTTYTVTVVSDSGEEDDDEVIVTVNPLLIANAGSDETICEGDSVTLTASGGTNYQWSTGESTQSITVSPNTTTTYSVEVFNNTCSDTDEVIVTVNALPDVSAGSDITITYGESTILTAEGADSYEWSTGTTTQSITVSPTDTTTYTVTGTTNGCTNDASVTVTVETEDVNANAGSDQEICEGESTTLTASGGTNYQWSTGATTQSITVSPNTTTTYSVTVSNDSGGEDTDEVTVTVTAIPIADAGLDEEICEDDSVTLTASGGTSYQWSTGETTQSITVSPNTTTIYSVEVFNNTCSDTDEVTVTVNALPDVSAGADVTITYGESTILTAEGADSYQWSTGETTQSIVVSPTVTTSYTVEGTTNACSSESSVTVTVETEDVNANAGLDQEICEDESTILTASGGTNYQWSTGETTQSITVSPNTTTTYSVIVSNDSGGEDTDEVTVTVNALPDVNAGSDITITYGESTILTAEGADSYQWSTGETTQSIVVSPTVTTSYTVEGTTNACSSESSVTVTVETEDVNANAGLDQEICEDESTILTASGGTNYQWSTGETTQSITVSPNTTTTYSVIVSNDSGGEDTDEVTVTVNALPDVSTGSDITITYGESTILTAEGADSYQWSTGETTQSIEVSPTVTTSYTVEGTTNACSTESSVTVTVEDLQVNASAGENQRVCDGYDYEVTLTASGGDTYFWSTGATTQSITVSPLSTTTYSVVAYQGNFQDEDEVTVFVDPNPNVVITNGEDVTILDGDYVTISASGANEYQWNNGATQPNIAVNPSITTTYEVTGYINDCSDTNQIVINVLPQVQAYAGEDVSICLSDSIDLTATGGDEYLWSTGETTQTITVAPDQTTDYTVTVFNALDYDEATVRVEVVIDCEEDPVENPEFDYRIFPNPTSDILNISLTGLYNTSKMYLYDVSGKMLVSSEMEETLYSDPFIKQLNLSNLNSGMYILKIEYDGKEIIDKVIIN